RPASASPVPSRPGARPAVQASLCRGAGDGAGGGRGASAIMSVSLETKDLTIRFGGHVAVDAVTCQFRPGELTAIVGPNGAGKTTYFNLISGQLRATGGAV